MRLLTLVTILCVVYGAMGASATSWAPRMLSMFKTGSTDMNQFQQQQLQPVSQMRLGNAPISQQFFNQPQFQDKTNIDFTQRGVVPQHQNFLPQQQQQQPIVVPQQGNSGYEQQQQQPQSQQVIAQQPILPQQSNAGYGQQHQQQQQVLPQQSIVVPQQSNSGYEQPQQQQQIIPQQSNTGYGQQTQQFIPQQQVLPQQSNTGYGQQQQQQQFIPQQQVLPQQSNTGYGQQQQQQPQSLPQIPVLPQQSNTGYGQQQQQFIPQQQVLPQQSNTGYGQQQQQLIPQQSNTGYGQLTQQALVPVSACSPSPCKNDGKCIESSFGANGFTCQCPWGYTGATCEICLNDCSSNPCPFNKKCKARYGGGFDCVCPADKTGLNCEIQNDVCSINQCFNGGVCVPVEGGSFHCQCSQPWAGERCERTWENPCNENVLRSNEVRQFKNPWDRSSYLICYDVLKFHSMPCSIGTYFNERLSHCVPEGYNPPSCPHDYCQNGGECLVDESNLLKCTCKRGFSGERCETNIDECLLEGNAACAGGRCVDQVNGFYCECASGVGINCRQTIANPCTQQNIVSDLHYHALSANAYLHCTSEMSFTVNRCPEQLFWHQEEQTCTVERPRLKSGICSAFPCKNGGECQDNGSGNFQCVCKRGYTGATCEQMIDFCLSSPCQNGGKCLSYAGGYTCICPDKVIDDCCCHGIINTCPPKSELVPGVNNYRPHLMPNRYIHCDFDGRAFVRTCAPQTTWHNDVLSCLPADFVKNTTSMTQSLPVSSNYGYSQQQTIPQQSNTGYGQQQQQIIPQQSNTGYGQQQQQIIPQQSNSGYGQQQQQQQAIIPQQSSGYGAQPSYSYETTTQAAPIIPQETTPASYFSYTTQASYAAPVVQQTTTAASYFAYPTQASYAAPVVPQTTTAASYFSYTTQASYAAPVVPQATTAASYFAYTTQASYAAPVVPQATTAASYSNYETTSTDAVVPQQQPTQSSYSAYGAAADSSNDQQSTQSFSAGAARSTLPVEQTPVSSNMNSILSQLSAEQIQKLIRSGLNLPQSWMDALSARSTLAQPQPTLQNFQQPQNFQLPQQQQQLTFPQQPSFQQQSFKTFQPAQPVLNRRN